MTEKEKSLQEAEEYLAEYIGARIIKGMRNGKFDFDRAVIRQYIKDATEELKKN